MSTQIIRYAIGDRVRIGVRTAPANTRGDELGEIHPIDVESLGALLALPLADLRTIVDGAVESDPVHPSAVEVAAGGPAARLLPPIDGLTEVWASGVTYRRSSEARQEESEVADVYARVYDAERPELFFKAVAWRVSGHGEPIGVRSDSPVNVPEPELALVCNAGGVVVGVTICDDVSSRSIEGENPLYLPQAKVYAGACALGPAITPIWEIPDPAALAIEMTVWRGDRSAWHGETSTALIQRGFGDLVTHLYRGLSFPHGAILSTGTGLVPDLSFTLLPGDEVTIDIHGVGRLSNPVRSADAPAFNWLTPEPARGPETVRGAEITRRTER
jgi:2-dehydro-3-deoxy-D-arabinonate dehydratase